MKSSEKNMATKSFDQMMVIDTPEKAAALNAAYYAAKKRGPLKFEGPSIFEMLKEGEEFIKNNPGWLKEAVALAKEQLEKEGIDISELSEED